MMRGGVGRRTGRADKGTSRRGLGLTRACGLADFGKGRAPTRGKERNRAKKTKGQGREALGRLLAREPAGLHRQEAFEAWGGLLGHLLRLQVRSQRAQESGCLSICDVVREGHKR